MALRHFTCNSLTGGTEGSLDFLWPGDDLIPAITILEGYLCTTIVDGDTTYFHRYDASSSAVESSPDVIKPDSNTGNGRWLLISKITSTETFTHPKYLSIAARDSYYVSNPSLLLDNLIVTVVNSSDFTLNDVWQYDLANTTWRSCGIHLASDITDFDAEVSNNIDVAFNTVHATGDGSDHSDVALNNSHRGQVTGNPHQVDYDELIGTPSNLDHPTVNTPVSLAWDVAAHTKGSTFKASIVSADSIPFFNSENSNAPESFTLDDLLQTSLDY